MKHDLISEAHRRTLYRERHKLQRTLCRLDVPSGLFAFTSNITCRACLLAKNFGVGRAKAETSDIKSATGRIRRGEHRRVCGVPLF
jgi:hypothetical protein